MRSPGDPRKDEARREPSAVAASSDSSIATSEPPEPAGGVPPASVRDRTCPYPGPRSFQAQEAADFCGRRREAQDLVSLLVSNPVVLFYAQSGAGKTSLINARLLQLLQARQYEVLPVARVVGTETVDGGNVFAANTLRSWNCKEPERTTIDAFLAQRAPSVDDDGDPTLRILIFDQLEELFTTHLGRWSDRQAFFEQLAVALRADPRLRILLALREDYLGSFDPHASTLPGGLRARLRLERLSEADALLAIEEPMRRTRVAFAPGAAQRIVDRLLVIRAHGKGEVKGDYVEPVQLQVVCRRLWFSLPTGTRLISESDVVAPGNDVQEALRDFYDRGVARASRKAHKLEWLVRRWIERRLITEGRTRGTAFHGETKTGGMANRVVNALDEERLVRCESRAGATWYELTHDTLIDPILRSNALAARRYALAVAATAIVTVALVVGISVWLKVAPPPAMKPVDELANLSPDALIQQLWADPKRRKELVERLQKAPQGTSAAPFDAIEVNDAPSTRGAFLVLHYAPGAIDPGRMQLEWSQKAAALARKGYYVPDPLQLQPDKSLAPRKLRLVLVPIAASNAPKADRSADFAQPDRTRERASARGAAVHVATDKDDDSAEGRNESTGAAPQHAAATTTVVKSGRRAEGQSTVEVGLELADTPAALVGGDLPGEMTTLGIAATALHGRRSSRHWWSVPETLWPLFRAKMPGLLRPREAFVTQRLYEQSLIDAPSLLIRPDALPYLLKHALVRAVLVDVKQMETLWKDVRREFRCPGSFRAALVETARGMNTLPDAADLVNAVLARGAPPQQTCNVTASEGSWAPVIDAVKEEKEALNATGEEPIRMMLGAGLRDDVSEKSDGNNTVRDRAIESIDRLRETLFQEHGIVGPGVRFRDASGELEPDQFRIETFEQTAADWEGRVQRAEPGKAIESLMAEIGNRYQRDSWRWLDVRMLSAMMRKLPDGTRTALRDLPVNGALQVLHDVLSPPPQWPANCPISEVSAEWHSLDHPEWLLSSLVFWRHLTDKAVCWSAGLRALQAARGAPAAADSMSMPEGIVKGVEALRKGDGVAAGRYFEQPCREDGLRATSAFLSLYAKGHSRQADIHEVESACVLPVATDRSSIAWSMEQRHRAGMFVKDPSLEPARRRHLQLCLLHEYGGMKFRTRTAELLTELAPIAADPSVPARQKHVFGYWLLDHALPDSTLAKTGIYRSPPAMDVASARTAQETLISALQGFDVESDAEAAASAILQRCALKGDAVRFCLDLIEQTAKARPNSLWANLDAAFNLATWSKSRAAESRVLALLTTAKANRDQAKQGKQRRLDAWFDATELYAGAWRIEDQSDAELAAVDRRWESLSRFPVGANGPDAASAWGQRVNLAIFRDERDKLRMLVDEGRTRRRDHSTTFINEFLFQLSEGKPNDAVSSLRRVLLDAKRSKESMVVMAVAIARLLQGEKFAPEIISNAIADDNYPIHVRLLLATAARLEGDPDWRKPLDETWQGVQKATWPNRLKAMDPLAWAEVLLGEYLGDSTAQELMRSVDEDAAFASSPLAGLEVPVGELRCERFFYQAIRTWAEGGENGRQEALALFGRVLATRKTSFFEHAMASFLIKKLTN